MICRVAGTNWESRISAYPFLSPFVLPPSYSLFNSSEVLCEYIRRIPWKLSLHYLGLNDVLIWATCICIELF